MHLKVMPQNKICIKTSIRRGFCPIVVINKIDRPNCDPENTVNLVFDLFVELGANEEITTRLSDCILKCKNRIC